MRLPAPLFRRAQAHTRPFGLACVCALSLTLVTACDKKKSDPEDSESSEKGEPSEKDKQERLNALLKENGLDPSSLPKAPPTSTTASPAQPAQDKQPPQNGLEQAQKEATTAPDAATPAKNAAPHTPTAAGEAPPAQQPVAIQLLSRGAAPYQKLRYQFKKDAKKNLKLSVALSMERRVGGQPVPGMPPFALDILGQTQTVEVAPPIARRLHTFEQLTPRVDGVPPEVAKQIAQQYAGLKGVQLIETVSNRGIMLGMELDQRAVHPQVLALMQHLQDGLTNAFLPLPEPAVGSGARWVATMTINTAGISLIQENEITLKSLEGSEAVFETKLKQHAKSSKIAEENLPPGVSIQLEKLNGGGSGKMKVDFARLLIESSAEVKTSVETAMTQAGAVAPIHEAANTSMNASITITDAPSD